MVKHIEYVDEEKMQISFSSFVFNVKNINEKFGYLTSFAEKFDLYGETNGKLFYLSEMAEPSQVLYRRMKKYFRSLDFTKGEDYFYIIKHPLSEINLEHPSCVDIPWLGSEITSEGNFLWFKDPAKALSVKENSKEPRFKKPQNSNEEQHLTFKILDSMDPKPSFPANQFILVPYERFILFEKNCLPVFIGTHAGTFPEEIIPEDLEGQKVALFYNSVLPITTTILHIVNGKRKEIKKIWVDGNL